MAKKKVSKGKVRAEWHVRKENKIFLTQSAIKLDVTESRVLDLIIDKARQDNAVLKFL